MLESGSGTKDCFGHLVYRRPEGNKSLTVTTAVKSGNEKFTLDLPTPIYRVVDIPAVGPNAKFSVVEPMANSSRFVRPRKIAPSARSRAMAVAS